MIAIGGAPPRVYVTILGINRVVASARNFWLWIKMPRQAKYERDLSEAWKLGYNSGVQLGMQSASNIRR